MNPTQKNPTQWAIYARVSTEDQAEKYSLASQIRHDREKVRQLGGGEVSDDMIFVDDCTGTNTNRPAFQRLNALIEGKAIAGVVIYTIDRLSRDVLDAVHYLRTCRRQNVRLEFLNLTIDDTPVGEFVFTLLAAVAQLERRTILERTGKGRVQKWREGFLHCGSVPFGYRYRGKQQGSRGEMVVHEPEAGTVRLVFELCADGMTVYGIKVRLNQEGIRSARGGMWSRQTVHQLLTNPAYIGRAVMGKGKEEPITVECPAIVTEELFAKAQLQLKKNSLARVGRPSNRYLLTGFLWCDQCNHRCCSKITRGRPAYRCANTNKFLYKHNCGAGEILQARIEPAVWNALWDALTNPAVMWELARNYHQEMAKPDAETRQSLKRRIARLEQQEARDLEILYDPAQVYADASKRLQTTRTELSIARDELAQMQVIEMPTREAIEAVCAQFAAGRNLEDFADQRAIIEMAVSKIKWAPKTQEVTIIGAIRLDGAAGDQAAAGGAAPARKSPGTAKLNCQRRVGADDNSFVSIPFILKRRVA